jgi:hypothetical protein
MLAVTLSDTPWQLMDDIIQLRINPCTIQYHRPIEQNQHKKRLLKCVKDANVFYNQVTL